MPEPILRDAVYSADDIAKLVGLKAPAVRRWIRDGKLPAKKLGKRWLVLGSDLLDALKTLDDHRAT